MYVVYIIIINDLFLCLQVCVSREGTVADYGLLAREDLEADEVLFTVPRTVLLSQHTSPLAPLLQKEHASLNSPSGWVPLLLSLLHESTAPHSRWAPYLSLWPETHGTLSPFIREEQKQLLQGTGVPEAVEKDLASIQEEFSSVVLPFMKAHPDLFNPKVHNLELYKRLVAFVMAYSRGKVENKKKKENKNKKEAKSIKVFIYLFIYYVHLYPALLPEGTQSGLHSATRASNKYTIKTKQLKHDKNIDKKLKRCKAAILHHPQSFTTATITDLRPDYNSQ
uniref:SET domain-containing protein n=1 Tax=Anolis carolinensis TaxID=28377 RepID=A0A803SXA2_ANOCA